MNKYKKRIIYSAAPVAAAIAIIAISIIVAFSGCGKKPGKQNVILLVTIDTLRKDHLGCYGYPRETSPFIDSLAGKGVVFQNAITPLPLTDASHASILTSQHPLVHGVLLNSTRLTKKVETIAEVMRKNGYYTIGTVSVSHLSKVYNFSQGFDSYSDKCDIDEGSGKKWTRLAQSVNKSLFQQIKEYKKKHSHKPLFIWVHYYDPHSPYTGWKDISFKTPLEKPNPHLENYDKEIRYTDNAIKSLFRFMEKEGFTDRMTTCITADHGEQFGEHGVLHGHNDIYTETVMVPLIFHGRGIARNKRVHDYVSTMDIAPTLLQSADLKFSAPVHGENLLDPKGKPLPLAGSKRGFMVIGSPDLVRSMEWISRPFSLILNFDHWYRHWYKSTDPVFPEERLTPVKESNLELKYLENSLKYSIFIEYPEKTRIGAHIGVLRFDLTENKGLTVIYQNGSRRRSGFNVKAGETGTITAYFPVTPLDRPTSLIYFKEDTVLKNFRYVILPAKEMSGYLNKVEKQKSVTFDRLTEWRKNRTGDELYNLDTDYPMVINLLEARAGQRTPPQVVEGKKQLYKWLEIYRKEGKKLRGKSRRNKPLSEKEKEMLKSLGYL